MAESPDRARELALANIADLAKIIQFNEDRGIRFFRITSNLFPHMENPRAPPYTIEFAHDALAAVGTLARGYGHRITMHPGQFAQLGSPNPDVVDQTLRDLNSHAAILLAMGLKPTLGSVIIIHGGGTYGDAAATLERFAANFARLPATTQQFIALENDEFQYTVLDLLGLCEKIGAPLCIDFFHHQVRNPFDIYDSALIARVMATWRRRGIKPKCHWSNQREDARAGAHSDCVADIPARILAICTEYDADIMLEVKEKDDCVMRLLPRYFARIVNAGRVEWCLKR
jgi:UV DNA damage endonuclease